MPIQATSLAIIMRPALLFVCWIASLSIVGEAAAPGWVTCGNLSAAYNRTACRNPDVHPTAVDAFRRGVGLLSISQRRVLRWLHVLP